VNPLDAVLVVIVVAALITFGRRALIRRGHPPRGRGCGSARPRPSRGRATRCRSGKVPFDSKADADRVVRRSQTQRRDGYDRPLQRSYRCPHCGHWHTTSQRKRARW
jgi:hypothetical protein